MEERGQVDINSIYKPIQDDLEKVERSLDAVIDVSIPILSELLQYVLKSGGKRIRAALTLLSGKFYNYNLELLIPMATGAELLHSATLVHDDIVDRSAIRHGKPTANNVWGEDRALLLGDYLFAKAGSLVATTKNTRATKLFADTLTIISGGELRQSDTTFESKKTRDYYYQWVSAKTASLFVMATESGATLAQSPEEAVTALKEYGYNLGMAFQIVDDIMDFVGDEVVMGKPMGSDLGQGAITLPLILFIESYPEDKLIRDAIENGNEQNIATIVEKIKNSPFIDGCLAIASDFSSRACKAIEKLPDATTRKTLFDLATFVVQRRK